jgi:hypothetical protein
MYILWHVRVAPLIIVDSGSLESVYWITRKSKLLYSLFNSKTLNTLRLN